jgi:hypothetical protein
MILGKNIKLGELRIQLLELPRNNEKREVIIVLKTIIEASTRRKSS